MTARYKILVSLIVIALIWGIAGVSALTDVSERIREYYPSASVSIYQGHSPGIHPVIDVLRMVRGKNFIPDTEWISIQIKSEARPIDLATLLQFQVQTIQLTHCKVSDLAPLLRKNPAPYAEFKNCDLSDVPADQKATLVVLSENPEYLFYGSP